MRINPKYQYKTTPKARDTAIVAGDKYRFTILNIGEKFSLYSAEGMIMEKNKVRSLFFKGFTTREPHFR